MHATYFNCIYIFYYYFLFVNDFDFFLLCSQLVVKTKYINTLIKLLIYFTFPQILGAYFLPNTNTVILLTRTVVLSQSLGYLQSNLKLEQKA